MFDEKLVRLLFVSVIITAMIMVFHAIPWNRNVLEKNVMKERGKTFSIWEVVLFGYYTLAALIGLYISEYAISQGWINF